MRYPGGKNGCGTWQKIINLMPPHAVYIEPFLGSGAIMRRKRPARANIGIDLDQEAVAGVSAAIFNSGGVRSITEVERSLSVIRGTITVSCDPVPMFDFFYADGIAWLSRFKPLGNELIYLDPPYLMETRRSGPLYRFEMTRADHRRLLEIILKLKCSILISGYWSELYEEKLSAWRSIHFPVMTRGGRMAVEWLWFNYQAPTALHDYRFLGNNFREREKLNRKITRWKSRLARMDVLERQAMLCAIEATPGPTRRE